jgi:hypothetical protein
LRFFNINGFEFSGIPKVLRFPNYDVSDNQSFRVSKILESRFLGFEGSMLRFLVFKVSGFQGIKILSFQGFRVSRFLGFH